MLVTNGIFVHSSLFIGANEDILKIQSCERLNALFQIKFPKKNISSIPWYISSFFIDKLPYILNEIIFVNFSYISFKMSAILNY